MSKETITIEELAKAMNRIAGEVQALHSRIESLEQGPGGNDYLTTTEAATALGVSLQRIGQLRAEKQVRTAKGPNRRVFYHRDDIAALKKRRHEIQPE